MKSWQAFRSVNFKMNLGIAAVLILVMGFSGYITYEEQKRQAIENTKAKAQLLTQTVTNIIRIGMEGKDEKDLDRLIRVVGQFRDIETLRIFSPDGLILHSADPDEVYNNIDELVMQVFQSGNKATPFQSDEKGHLSFCRVEAIYNEEQCHRCHGHETEVIGILEVCLSMADTDNYIASNARFMGAATFGTILIVGAAISLLATFLVKRPISSLERTMERASKGDLKVRAATGSNDEFASLGTSFNEMIAKLEQSGNEIERLHQEEMSRAERLASIGEMAASVAHEIKNPLAGLSGATQVLSKSFGADDPRRQAAEEMLKLINRLDKTINDLLKFARVNTPSWQMANVNDVIDETLFFVGKEEGDAGPVMRRELDPAMPEIPIDPKLMQQVLLNLVINARQATKADGWVCVESHASPTGPLPHGLAPSGYVEIKVSDNGPGISPELLHEIFKPFFTTKVQGTGLGLSISRNIIEAHSGAMEVRSQAGVGTDFYLWLRKEIPIA